MATPSRNHSLVAVPRQSSHQQLQFISELLRPSQASLHSQYSTRNVYPLARTAAVRTQEMDGVSGITQCQIQPNVTAIYRFKPDKCGTFWFHGHEEVQYAYGLRGPLIVHCPPNLKQSWEKDVYKEYTILLADWYHDLPVGAPIWDTVLINNVGRYNAPWRKLLASSVAWSTSASFQFVPGKKYLLRLINTSAMAAFKVSIDGHTFQVVASDADYLKPSSPANSVTINVAQRYDILVQAKSSPLRQGSARSGCDPTSSEWTTEVAIGEFDYNPAVPVVLPTTPDQRIIVEFTLGVLAPNPTAFLGYISLDGRDFSSLVIPDSPPLFTIAQGAKTEDLPTTANAIKLKHNDHVEVVVVNETPDQHPFHLHAHSPWIVEAAAPRVITSWRVM
ncbi:Multicopper oxidase, type 3 [Phytophthora cactorum]|nr:Multicopper oxidase, type 3 [Phytophthora cactorum]